MEANALLLGVELMTRIGRGLFVLESDCAAVVQRWCEDGMDFSQVRNIVAEFKRQCENTTCIRVHKICRNQNCLVDVLAKYAMSLVSSCF